MPPIMFGAGQRSRANTIAVLDQFPIGPSNEETHQRWRPIQWGGRLETWCNIFLWDITRAFGCEVPYVILRGAAWVPQRANNQIAWLASLRGRNAGWQACDENSARVRAELGFISVAAWQNVGDAPGHVAIVRPAPNNDGSSTFIAQAGASCFLAGRLQQGFGALPVRFFTHS